MEFLTAIFLLVIQINYDVFIFKSVMLLDFIFYCLLGSFNLFLLLSKLIDDESLIDGYLQATTILITAVTFGRVGLEIFLCKKYAEPDLHEEFYGHKPIMIKMIERDP